MPIEEIDDNICQIKLDIKPENLSTDLVQDYEDFNNDNIKQENINPAEDQSLEYHKTKSKTSLRTKLQKCSKCNFISKKESELKKHLSEKHDCLKKNNFDLKCDNCDFKTETKESLDKHSILKHFKMNYKDDSTADKEFTNSDIKTESEGDSAGINKTEKFCLKQNKQIEKNDEEKKYTCEECGKEYYSKKGLKYHNDAYHKVKKDLGR